jgi:predicted RNase H-like nuclease (RuvC/YqgF family)
MRMDAFSALFAVSAVLLAAVTAKQAAEIRALRNEIEQLKRELHRHQRAFELLEEAMESFKSCR